LSKKKLRKQKAAKRLKTEQTKTQNETLELTSAKKQKKKTTKIEQKPPKRQTHQHTERQKEQSFD